MWLTLAIAFYTINYGSLQEISGGYNNNNPTYNNPGYNIPEYTNQGYNNPQYNNPNYNNPQYNNPNFNNPQYPNQGYGNVGYNNPQYNSNPTLNTRYGSEMFYDQLRCPQHWVQFQQSCYRFIKSPLRPYNDARRLCQVSQPTYKY